MAKKITIIAASDSIFELADRVASDLHANVLWMNGNRGALRGGNDDKIHIPCPDLEREARQPEGLGALATHRFDRKYFTSDDGQVNNDPAGGFMGALKHASEINRKLMPKIIRQVRPNRDTSYVAYLARLTGGSASGALLPVADLLSGLKQYLQNYEIQRILIATRSTQVERRGVLQRQRNNEVAAIASLAAATALEGMDFGPDLVRQAPLSVPLFEQQYLIDSPTGGQASEQQQLAYLETFAQTVLDPDFQEVIQPWAAGVGQDLVDGLLTEWLPAGVNAVVHDPRHLGEFLERYAILVAQPAAEELPNADGQAIETRIQVYSRLASDIDNDVSTRLPAYPVLEPQSWPEDADAFEQSIARLGPIYEAGSDQAYESEVARIQGLQAASPLGLLSRAAYESADKSLKAADSPAAAGHPAEDYEERARVKRDEVARAEEASWVKSLAFGALMLLAAVGLGAGAYFTEERYQVGLGVASGVTVLLGIIGLAHGLLTMRSLQDALAELTAELRLQYDSVKALRRYEAALRALTRLDAYVNSQVESQRLKRIRFTRDPLNAAKLRLARDEVCDNFERTTDVRDNPGSHHFFTEPRAVLDIAGNNLLDIEARLPEFWNKIQTMIPEWESWNAEESFQAFESFLVDRFMEAIPSTLQAIIDRDRPAALDALTKAIDAAEPAVMLQEGGAEFNVAAEERMLFVKFNGNLTLNALIADHRQEMHSVVDEGYGENAMRILQIYRPVTARAVLYAPGVNEVAMKDDWHERIASRLLRDRMGESGFFELLRHGRWPEKPPAEMLLSPEPELSEVPAVVGTNGSAPHGPTTNGDGPEGEQKV